jgi:hypothetical protein
MKRQIYFKNSIYEHGHVDPWWTNEHTTLDYYRLIKFNNAKMVEDWKTIGYACDNSTFGSVYAMPQPMPASADQFFHMFTWNNISLSFFKMQQGDILPTHADHYTFYKNTYKIEKIENIHRCIVFLEDWDSGHYFDINGDGIINWKKGDYVVWKGDTLHMAANIGTSIRYTLQITGNTQ